MKCFICINSSILKTILFSTYYYELHFTNEENKDLGRLYSRVRMQIRTASLLKTLGKNSTQKEVMGGTEQKWWLGNYKLVCACVQRPRRGRRGLSYQMQYSRMYFTSHTPSQLTLQPCDFLCSCASRLLFHHGGLPRETVGPLLRAVLEHTLLNLCSKLTVLDCCLSIYIFFYNLIIYRKNRIFMH